jgi:predicted metal-dependent RNase
MKIYFHGAAGDVTGSAYHVKTRHASVLVDCGLYQGGNESRLSRPRLIITHGENRARKTLSDLIRSRHGVKPEIPNLGDVIEI